MLQPIISRKASCPFVADISNESENSNHFHSDLELIFLLSGRITYLISGIQYNLKRDLHCTFRKKSGRIEKIKCWRKEIWH